MDLVLRGTLCAEGAVIEGGWVAVRDGRIAAFGRNEVPTAREVRDFGEALILPGIVDGQTHATSYKGLAGMAETTASALAGGVTTIVDMPYDNPLPLDRRERLEAKVAAIREHSHCDVALYGTATAETGTAHLAELIEGGVAAFKISSFEANPTRFPRIAADLTLDLMEALAPTGLPLGLHNEDQEIVRTRLARLKAEGRNDIAAHSESRPLAAELAATAQFLALGQATGGHAHIVHLSHGQGFEQVGAFAAIGASVTGELCVHYLCFNAEADGPRLGALMKVNPPIRANAIAGLWGAIRKGQVAFVSSDHASWPIDNKLGGSIFEAGAGVPGLETLLPAFFTAAEGQGLEGALLAADLLAEKPARFFGIDDRKGRIASGMDADFAIVERGSFVWKAADAHDGLNWSPFDGRTFTARVVGTWLRGREAWNGRAVLSRPGEGIFVPRRTRGWFNDAKEA
ncbi:dihydroorotase [Microvirga zambiensis]|uniref:dihydroorotase n=1 Tax=Microvirga zambiensis TaxID=1402137 RepID=UPI00191CDA25|nr:amidohydrolase family protein [Microvirga zambiensis]